MAELPGVDLAVLTQWLDTEHPGLRADELEGAVIAGGRSNLTYRITDGTTTWALRRPPLGHVLATAHDMAREFRVIRALSASEVPVADAVAFCADPTVLGAPFYLMSFVEGVVLDHAHQVAALDRATARKTCEDLVDTLVALHAVDPNVVGLEDFGRPEGFLARQLTRWHQQWKASETMTRPELDSLVKALDAGLPRQSAPALVHGDYRLTNLIYHRDLSGVAAVVDWEMATRGDPLTDLGLLVVYQTLAADGVLLPPPLPPGAGFLSPGELAERYGRCSGRDLSDLAWFVAFGYFKLAVIFEGIHHRYLEGKTVGDGFEHLGAGVPTLIAAASHHLRDREI